jgi:hypothetical protein
MVQMDLIKKAKHGKLKENFIVFCTTVKYSDQHPSPLLAVPRKQRHACTDHRPKTQKVVVTHPIQGISRLPKVGMALS